LDAGPGLEVALYGMAVHKIPRAVAAAAIATSHEFYHSM
jgi:hypothetical protein